MGNQDDDRNDQKSEYLYFYFATKIYTHIFWPKLKELDNFSFFPYFWLGVKICLINI